MSLLLKLTLARGGDELALWDEDGDGLELQLDTYFDNNAATTLTADQAALLMQALAAWLTARQPEGSGTTTLGTVALNGREEICFFPHSRADGIPIPLRPAISSRPDIVRLTNAIERAPRRRVPHPVLRALDPPDPA